METKISKRLIKKAEELIGDDTGYIDSLETLIDSAKSSAYFDWINEICTVDASKKDVHYLVDLYCNGSHEHYYKKLIHYALINGSLSFGDIEKVLVTESEKDYQKRIQ